MHTNSESRVVEILKNCKIDCVLTLPCDKIKNLLRLVEKNFYCIPLTREEEGVGIAAGLAVTGRRPLILVQSSGIGNMVNALCSLTKVYELPLPLLISWRGVYNEPISAQVPMGKNLPALLSSIDVRHELIDEIAKIELIEKVIHIAFEKNIIYAGLLSPKLWENSKPIESETEPEARKTRRARTISSLGLHRPKMTRYEILKAALPYLHGRIVVSNIGIPSKELYHLCDQESNFYMLGSFGLASSIGLGIALGTKKDVLVIDGDGSILTNPNTLCTIAHQNPKNLTILCIDNGVHGSTGNQPTAAQFIDLELVAKSFGFKNTTKIYTATEVRNALECRRRNPRFIHAIAKIGNENLPEIPHSPPEIMKRIKKFLSR